MKLTRHVPRDRRQPRAERTVVAKRMQTIEGVQKRFLDDVVRIADRAACQRNAMDHRCVAKVQTCEGRAVSVPRGLHVGCVVADLR